MIPGSKYLLTPVSAYAILRSKETELEEIELRKG